MPLPSTMTCPHFGVCGGCACVTAPDGTKAPPPYEEELQAKELRVRELLASVDVQEWRPIVPSPETWHYRNKMEFAFAVGWETPELVLGLRQTGRFDRVVDLELCLLISPDATELLRRVRAWAKANGLAGYHRSRHTGDLKYLVVREGKNTDQRMAFLIAAAPLTEMQIASLREIAEPLTDTFLVGVNPTKSDMARAEQTTVLWGSGVIEEKLRDLRFQISPYSFFQTNTRGTEQLYDLLDSWGQEQSGALLDLYCGAGGIGLSMAKRFDRVVGIDTNRDAIADAAANAQRNDIGNAEFVCEDTMEFLKKLPASKLSIQIAGAVVDPPRPGLHPKAMQTLLDINPPRLAYISCNPESLARDLQLLAPYYGIRSAQPVDLFPHTAHVETLALLEHK